MQWSICLIFRKRTCLALSYKIAHRRTSLGPCILMWHWYPFQNLQITNELNCKLPLLRRVNFSNLKRSTIKHQKCQAKEQSKKYTYPILASIWLTSHLIKQWFSWIWQLTFSLPLPLTDTISPVLSVAPFLVTGVQLRRTSPSLHR